MAVTPHPPLYHYLLTSCHTRHTQYLYIFIFIYIDSYPPPEPSLEPLIALHRFLSVLAVTGVTPLHSCSPLRFELFLARDKAVTGP